MTNDERLIKVFAESSEGRAREVERMRARGDKDSYIATIIRLSNIRWRGTN